jgi:hypothetical protein
MMDRLAVKETLDKKFKKLQKKDKEMLRLIERKVEEEREVETLGGKVLRAGRMIGNLQYASGKCQCFLTGHHFAPFVLFSKALRMQFHSNVPTPLPSGVCLTE